MNYQIEVERLYKQACETGIVATIDMKFQLPIQIEMGVSFKTCEKDIDELDLSVRAQNCLKRAGIMKVRQLLDIAGTDELMKLRNLGRKSLIEIKTTLLSVGYEQLDEDDKRNFWAQMLELNPNSMRTQ